MILRIISIIIRMLCISKKLVVLVITFLCSISIMAQHDSINIYIELISVATSDFHKLDCQNEGGFLPIGIYVEFVVENNSEKELFFMANTAGYYQEKESEEYRVGGQFVMINKQDTILLFTSCNTFIPRKEKEFICWGAIGYTEDVGIHPAFNSFLCQFSSNLFDGKKALFEYIKNSTFQYIPIIKDYKINLKNGILESDSVIFPQRTITVRQMNPLKLILSNLDVEDEEITQSNLYYGE